MRSVLFCFLLLTNLNLAFGQDQIAQKMEWLAKTKPTSNLFVHFDKNIYSNNETVYFTGYLLNLDSLASNQHRVMAVALIRAADSTVISQDKFYMKDGLSFGNLTIIDKILPGNYYFIAYTDIVKNGMPEVTFLQAITIKTALDQPFKANMSILNDPTLNKEEKKILLNITSSEGTFLKEPILISYKYGNKLVNTKADKSGQLLISLPIQNNITDPNIYVKIKYRRDSNFISMAIPQPKNKATVQFYPEGGNLVVGTPSIIAWEVKDQQKLPLLTKAILYKNDEIINELETNDYGIGKFRLIPEKDCSYKIKLTHSLIADSIYFLPKPQQSGLIINITKAVVNDTLKVLVRNNAVGKITIRVHNFQFCYLTMSFNLTANIQLFSIPLTNVPKGLATSTITDSLDRPLAERMFFAHYNQGKQLSINTDKSIYGQREKVQLKINLTNPNNNAIVSIAGVQNSRLSVKNMQDIANFNYLTSELTQLPQNLNANALADQNYMEQILLVKGWRKYTWQELENVTENSATIKTDTLLFTGKLTYKKKNIFINNVITFGSPKPLFIPVDTLGNFHVDSDQMVEKPGTRLFFLLNNAERIIANYDYQIKVNDPFLTMNAKLAKQFNPEKPILPSSLLNNTSLILKNNERAILLKEVVIGNKNDRIIENDCGDYVCPFNILNCVNHVGNKNNTLPYLGRFYIAYSGRPEKVQYKGCFEPTEGIFFSAKPIFLNKEFYLNDYKDPQEPAFFSTIYWNYGLILNGNKEANLEFYTSDITGKFRVVVQGITDNEVIYGEHYFEVKTKENP